MGVKYYQCDVMQAKIYSIHSQLLFVLRCVTQATMNILSGQEPYYVTYSSKKKEQKADTRLKTLLSLAVQYKCFAPANKIEIFIPKLA